MHPLYLTLLYVGKLYPLELLKDVLWVVVFACIARLARSFIHQSRVLYNGLYFMNSDHVNDAASEAITYAFRPQAISPLYAAPEIDDFDDGLDSDDLMLLNRQSPTAPPAPTIPVSPRPTPNPVSQDSITYEPNSQQPQPAGPFYSQSYSASRF
jgi:hypothetical protein